MFQQDPTSFDDSKLQWEMKQTAQFFNPLIPQSFQNNGIQRVPYKIPKDQPFRVSDKKNAFPTNKVVKKKASLQSEKQIQQIQQIVPVMHKFGSPPKLVKVPSVKPFSPPQPKTNFEAVHINKNQSQVPPQYQKQVSLNDADQNRQAHMSTKQSEERPEYPSYQKSLLGSRQSEHNNDNLQRSNSSAFLPKINQQFKLQTKFQIGYGSIYSQQETAVKTNSSQNHTNEFLHLNPTFDVRKSKTAQEHLRESQSNLTLKYKFNSAEQTPEQLPQIQSPASQAKFTFQTDPAKPKKFLQRTPQTKIISRLFSSKSDQMI